MARICIKNALFFGNDKFSSLLIPWCTYTDPEVAHVGLHQHDLIRRRIPFDTYTKEFSDVDRAKCEGSTTGFVKVCAVKLFVIVDKFMWFVFRMFMITCVLDSCQKRIRCHFGCDHCGRGRW